jgi:hypothetical protein
LEKTVLPWLIRRTASAEKPSSKSWKNIYRIYKLARPGSMVSVKFLNCPQGRKNVKNANVLDNHPWDGVTRLVPYNPS